MPDFLSSGIVNIQTPNGCDPNQAFRVFEQIIDQVGAKPVIRFQFFLKNFYNGFPLIDFVKAILGPDPVI
jgi:hypothetical protein